MITWIMSSLVIQSEEINAVEITQSLKKEPTRFTNKGDLVSKRSPNTTRRTHTTWVLESGLDEGEELDSHLEVLLSFIDEKFSELTELARKCTFVITIGCSFEEQGEIILEPNILKKISQLPFNMVISFYPPDNLE
jgi:hypothetical protein